MICTENGRIKFRTFSVHIFDAGKHYPAKFDNRNKIDINVGWNINDRLELTGQWEYMTGNRTTLALYNIASPDAVFPDAPFVSPLDPDGKRQDGMDYFENRNNVRIPAFHRLNLNLCLKRRLNSRLTYQWDFGLYNAYCRMNPFTVVKNYDNLDWEEFTPSEFSMMGTMDSTADYVFQVLASQINQGIQGWQPDGVFGYPFSDKGIDGKLYTLTVNEVLQTPFTDMIEKLPRKVNLYSISRAYYEYMVSVLAMDYDESALKGNLLSLGLIEPEKIYSNIQGGTGIMGCYNLTSRRIDLLQLTGGWPSH